MNCGWVLSSVIVARGARGLLAITTLLPLTARAQAPAPTAADRIVLVGNATNEITTARVRAELQSDGWQVVDVGEDTSLLQSLASANNAVAAIRVQANPSACEIWVTRGGAASDASSEIIEGSSGADAVLALQAVEVLRARLLKIGIVAPKSTPVVPPVPTMPAPVKLRPGPTIPREHSPVWLGVGPALVASPGGFSPNVMARITLTGRVRDRWFANTRIWVPVTPAQNNQPEGTSEFWLTAVTAGFGWEIGNPDSPLVGRVHAGLGAMLLQFQTEATPAFGAHAPTLVTATSYIALEVAARLSPRLRIGLDLNLGATAPRPVLTVAERMVAHWGRPLVTGGIFGEFDVAPRGRRVAD